MSDIGTTVFDGTISFYGRGLGFPGQEHRNDPGGRSALLRCLSGGVVEIFEDSPQHPAEASGGVKVAVELDEVDELYNRVRQAEVEVVDPLGDRRRGRRAFEINDPSELPLVLFTALESR